MMTIRQAIDDTVFYYESKGKAESTVKNLKGKLDCFAMYLAKDCQIAHVHLLRQHHLTDYQNYISRQTNGKGKAWVPTYMNVHFWVVRQMLKYLERHNHIAVRLSQLIEDVSTPEILPKNVMAHEEFQLMLKQIDKSTDIGYRDLVLFSLMGSSGIRVSECSMIDFSDVNLQERTIFIRKGKGDKQRLAIFGESVQRLLESYINSIRPFWKNADTEQALFLGCRGSRLGIKGIENAMKNYVTKAGLPTKLTPHSLRKYLTTELVKAECNPYHIKNICGWASLSPMKHYAKLSTDDLKKSLSKYHPQELEHQKAN